MISDSNIDLSSNREAYFLSFDNKKYYEKLFQITLLAENTYLRDIREKKDIDISEALKASID